MLFVNRRGVSLCLETHGEFWEAQGLGLIHYYIRGTVLD